MVDCLESDSCDSEGNPIQKPEFKNIALQRLDAEYQLARDKEKYCLIFDQSEQAQRFFAYKGNLKEFHKEVVQVRMGKKLVSDANEVLRKGIVFAMRSGDVLVVNCDKTTPDFVN